MRIEYWAGHLLNPVLSPDQKPEQIPATGVGKQMCSMQCFILAVRNCSSSSQAPLKLSLPG